MALARQQLMRRAGGQQLLPGVALVVGDGLAATAVCCAVEAAVLRRLII